MQPPTPTNDSSKSTINPKGNKFMLILSWVFSVFLILISFGAFGSKEVIPGLVTFLLGLIFLPPLSIKFRINWIVKTVCVIFWFIIFGVTVKPDSTKNNITENKSVKDSISSLKEIEKPQMMQKEASKEETIKAISKHAKQTKVSPVTLESSFIIVARNYYSAYKRYNDMCYKLKNRTISSQKMAKHQKIIKYYQNNLVPTYRKLSDAQIDYLNKYDFYQFSDLFVKYNFLKVIYDYEKTFPYLPDICDF